MPMISKSRLRCFHISYNSEMISSQCLLRSDPSDLARDRQIALGGKPYDVTWCDRCVIEDDSRRLDPRLGGLARYIIQGSCR